MRNWIYSEWSNLFKLGTFWTNSESFSFKKSIESLTSSTCIHFKVFYFSFFLFYFFAVSSNFKFTSPSKNFDYYKNSHNSFRKVTKYLIADSSGRRVFIWCPRSSLLASLNYTIFFKISKRSNFQYSGDALTIN